MKLHYYGTAAAEGVPAIFCTCDTCLRSRAAGGRNIRSRSQALVDGALLIDFPADTWAHSVYDGLPLWEIEHILITHDHSDHLVPDDFEMRGPELCATSLKPLTVYGSPEVGAHLVPALDRFGLSASKDTVFQPVLPFEPFDAGGFTVTALPANHNPETGPYIYLVEHHGQVMLYAHDTGYFPEETWRYLETAKPSLALASLDCTGQTGNPLGRERHMGYETCKQVRERLCEAGCGEKTVWVVNHFSHNGGATYDELAAVAEQEGFTVAYDGLEIEGGR